MLKFSLRISLSLRAKHSYGANRRGVHVVVAGRETRRQVDEVLDIVLERHALHSFTGLRVLYATYHQTQVDIGIGVTVKLMKLGTRMR